jgi:hypothetical protein
VNTNLEENTILSGLMIDRYLSIPKKSKKNTILPKLNFGLPFMEDMEGIVRKKLLSGETYICYIKDKQIISTVNVDNLDEYEHDEYFRPSYLNVLFRELGSDKKLRVGRDGEVITEDSLYSIHPHEKYEWDWDLINKFTAENEERVKEFLKNKKERNEYYPRISFFPEDVEDDLFNREYVEIRWLKSEQKLIIGACIEAKNTEYQILSLRDFFDKMEITKEECLKAFEKNDNQ